MDVLQTIISIAANIYTQCDSAETNKKLCGLLQHRIEHLKLSIEDLVTYPEKSKKLKRILLGLLFALKNAERWVNRYSRSPWWRRLIEAKKGQTRFHLINAQLSHTTEALQLQMGVEQYAGFPKRETGEDLATQRSRAGHRTGTEVINEFMEQICDFRRFLSSIDSAERRRDRLKQEIRNVKENILELMDWSPNSNKLEALIDEGSLMEYRATEYSRGCCLTRIISRRGMARMLSDQCQIIHNLLTIMDKISQREDQNRSVMPPVHTKIWNRVQAIWRKIFNKQEKYRL
ncbi:uncharacterized protein LOC134969742 [Pseudophryne corroboree]|uniref:uncharacterized protein LOC134969742 n=1 Tax=Pseudophryne corroboree TaxID=495146 RepID=UPI00308207D8